MNRFLVSSRQKLPLSSLAAVARKFSTNDVKLLQTVYHDMHLELGGKMVGFF